MPIGMLIMSVSYLIIVPDCLVSLGVDVGRVYGEEHQAALQALSLDLLEGGFTDKLGRLQREESIYTFKFDKW